MREPYLKCILLKQLYYIHAKEMNLTSQRECMQILETALLLSLVDTTNIFFLLLICSFSTAQFNGSERQLSPSPSSDRRRQLRAPGGGFKPIKHGSPELCGILGERVDPNVALEKQMWVFSMK